MNKFSFTSPRSLSGFFFLLTFWVNRNILFDGHITIDGLRCSRRKKVPSSVLIISHIENIPSRVVCADGNSDTNLCNANRLQKESNWYGSYWSKFNAQYTRNLLHLKHLLCSAAGLISISTSSLICMLLRDLSCKSFSRRFGIKSLYWQTNCFNSILQWSIGLKPVNLHVVINEFLGNYLSSSIKLKRFRIQPI